MRTVTRNGAIDLMRFLFCLIIVFTHSRNLGSPPDGTALFASAGYIGVEFFFIVAGFLMARSALSKDKPITNLGIETVQFLFRKIKAILPYYCLAGFFSFGFIILSNGFSFLDACRTLLLGIWDLFFLRVSGIKTYTMIRATWYLSAMFLAMFMLYPLLRKYRHTFTHIIAPLFAIFGLGYLSKVYGNLDQYTKNWNLVYSGFIRAIAELSLGCVCYVVCEKIKEINFTMFSRILITLTQVILYVIVFRCIHDLPCKQFDFVLVPMIAICVTLSFSCQGVAAPLFQGKIFTWLGKMSMIFYLNNMWIKDTIAWLLPESLGYYKLLTICIGCVFVISVLSYFFIENLMRFLTQNRLRFRSWFLK